jgi:SagB-type dehydrogenase family enzyme
MNKKRILLVCILFASSLPSLTIRNQNLALCQKEENEYGILSETPLETVISRRMSIRNFDPNVTVPWELVSKVLWAAYTYSWRDRTIPTFSGCPIITYVCNQTAAYKFVPENQSLTLWKNGDYRGLGGGYVAPTQLYIILDANICPDLLWGNAESGCAIQNIYLMANALNLGTVCTYPNRTDIHHGLGLPGNEEVLYKMPLGYPLAPYADYQNLMPTFRPSSSELPEIQDSNLSLEEALDSISSSHDWSNNPVTRQELSQILWTSYGYSYYEDTAESPPERHRTVPSAHGYYPMKIYAANSSGVYEYLPGQHTLATIVIGDVRSSIAQASGNAWASSAPLIIAVAYVVDSRPWIGGEETYVEVGSIAQNVFLEGAAWGLTTNLGRSDSNEEAMREALGLTGQTQLHPVSIIGVGHPSSPFSLIISSSEGGATDPLSGTYSYQAGSSANITAVPRSGYSFDHWLLDGEEMTENPKILIMNANHTLEAVFIDNIPPEIDLFGQEPSGNVTAYQNVTVTASVTETGSGLHNITLLCSTDNGTTWIPQNMTESLPNTYQATINGHENCTWVTYKIIAYDNNGNQAVNDNHGYYHIFHVIPEFPSLIILLLSAIISLLTVIVNKKKVRQNRHSLHLR